MPAIVYDWKRFWVPREGALAFDSEGFLAPPTDSKWSFWQSDVVGFDELAQSSCLILLGEPGIGKTVATRDAHKRTLETRTAAKCLFYNLGTYGDEQRLVKDIFASVEFRLWQSKGGELHMFLDSFDECLLRLDTLASLLSDQISRLESVEGLSLRIASRTAEWRPALEAAMLAKWGDSVKAYELAPLTRDQVELAATSSLADAERFIREVIERDVVSFAIKPLTLELLLRVWKADGAALPPTQGEI